MMVLVTGATGFVGRAVVRELCTRGHTVRAVVRSASSSVKVEQIEVPDIGPETDWMQALDGVDAVVHLAARVHNLHDHPRNFAEYFRVNAHGTVRLATCAAKAGVRRLVFVSSIKVNGESTPDHPFSPNDAPLPTDAYGQSKLEAERGLKGVASIESVIIRPPLVYGPGAKGNLDRLCRIASLGLPLPVGSVRNRRDLIGVDNLSDLIVRCVDHPAAAGQVFLASDGQALSTQELYRHICEGLGRRARIFSVPVGLLRIAARVAGVSSEMDRLTDSLQVNIDATRSTLNWTPPHSARSGIAAMAQQWAVNHR